MMVSSQLEKKNLSYVYCLLKVALTHFVSPLFWSEIGEESFVGDTLLSPSAADAINDFASEFPPPEFLFPAENSVEATKPIEASSLGKRSVSRALFDDLKKRIYITMYLPL